MIPAFLACAINHVNFLIFIMSIVSQIYEIYCTINQIINERNNQKEAEEPRKEMHFLTKTIPSFMPLIT